MKRWISFLLAGLLVFCPGCGAGQENAAAGMEEPAVQEETSSRETEEEEQEEEETVPSDEETDYADIVFETVDLDGNAVNSLELFGEHKITMINLWATWCGPCVGEMPELAQLSGEFAEKDCGLIAICLDAEDGETIAGAKEILESAGVSFPVVGPFPGVDEMFLLYAIPTSFFVDSSGKVLCDPVIGADPEQYRAVVEKLLGTME